MLDANEIKQIKQVVKEEVDTSTQSLKDGMEDLSKTLRGEMENQGKGLRGEMEDLGKTLRQEIQQSNEKLRAEIKSSNQKVSVEIGNFINDNILPQIEEKADKSDIARLERKIDKIIEKEFDHDSEIKKLKEQMISLPHS